MVHLKRLQQNRIKTLYRIRLLVSPSMLLLFWRLYHKKVNNAREKHPFCISLFVKIIKYAQNYINKITTNLICIRIRKTPLFSSMMA